MIRKLAPLIEDAMVQVHTKEAEIKAVASCVEAKALDSGIKTNSGQETYAEASEELKDARIKVGVAREL